MDGRRGAGHFEDVLSRLFQPSFIARHFKSVAIGAAAAPLRALPLQPVNESFFTFHFVSTAGFL